ncbi:carboxypeptidase regulatory-like domain-containing protein, partial [Salegentibacter sp. HM20]
MKNNYKRLKTLAYVFVAVLLIFLAFTATANAATPTWDLPQQQIEISGTVKDSKGLPIGGATVAIEATNRGTITDMDGNF